MSDHGNDIEQDSAGKHLILRVPDFATDPVKEPSRQTSSTAPKANQPPSIGGPMTTYLRMGASAEDPKREPGHDLVDLLPQLGPLANNLVNNCADGSFKTGQTFDDDVRDILGPNHGLDGSTLVRESNQLTSRGGWRDHTDGNRITTTRGDKVEIIRGNYKMVVLGRSDDPQGAVGWDLSNQNLIDFGNGATPGSSVETRYRADKYGGCWELINLVCGYVTHSTTCADSYEYIYGDHIETTTGSEDPHPGADYKAAKNWDGSGLEKPGPNPDIKEKTWAKTITSYTGSAKLPVNVISEETFAIEMNSVTNAVNIVEATTATMITSATTAAASINEATTATAINSMTTVGGAISEQTQAAFINEQVVTGMLTSSTTVAGVASDMTNASAINSIVNAGAITEQLTAAAATSLSAVGVAATMSLLGTEIDAKIAGLIENVTIAGAEIDITIVPLIVDILVAAKLAVHLGGKVEFNLSAALDISIAKWELHEGKIQLGSCAFN